ncbi:MAG TPA: prephenate dehydrogenase/arogenate dehydrogenase family protein [Candidatus Saccharimonadales bacterium]|nr:prephenate dehydrogenase/arogenate dehydrogenase family protein [Candidatus Saccharimonadales bacterium]
MSFGIIGYGSFGKFIAGVLSEFGDTVIASRRETDVPRDAKYKAAGFEEAASRKIVILAVGLDALEETSRKLAPHVSEKTIVVDVTSVKLKPIDILTRTLGGKCRILATHPLFGPHTVPGGKLAGQSIVVCPYEFDGRDKIMDFLKNKLGLKVIEMSAEDHDKEMAWVHGLTFFVGRGLMELDPPKSGLSTGYYQKLLDLVELESSHSIELFNTVQRGNPYAADIRRELIGRLESIDAQLKDK